MEDKGLVWSTDKDGNWFVGNPEDIIDPNDLSEEEKNKCVMLDFKDLKKLAYSRSMFLQISQKPLRGHSRWKVWLTSLLLLMGLLVNLSPFTHGASLHVVYVANPYVYSDGVCGNLGINE
jgi:hypothetical protein